MIRCGRLSFTASQSMSQSPPVNGGEALSKGRILNYMCISLHYSLHPMISPKRSSLKFFATSNILGLAKHLAEGCDINFPHPGSWKAGHNLDLIDPQKSRPVSIPLRKKTANFTQILIDNQ